MPAIHQLVAGYSRRDAISDEARVLRALFRRWGYASEIFCETRRILPELRADARDLSAAPAALGTDDIALLHLSVGSPAHACFAGLRCRRALLYHNITPGDYFRSVNPHTAALLDQGRAQIAALRDRAEVVMADSRFNARELASAGYRNVRVLPLVLDLAPLAVAPDRRVRRRLAEPCPTFLFVGRCAPNKRIEDLLTCMAIYQRTIDPRVRFVHVGSTVGVEPYHALLLARGRELGLERWIFAGSVSSAELVAYYRAAAAFVCLSEHEGFCIPLLEAMACDCPVVALARAAVPETLDGAGVLVYERDLALVAETLRRVGARGPLRAAIVAGQRARLERYRHRDLAAELKAHLAPLGVS